MGDKNKQRHKMTLSSKDIFINPIGPRDVVQHVIITQFQYYLNYG